MQLLPHGNLGKGIVEANALGGFCVPSSGVGRVLLAFGIIIVLGLLFDAMAGQPASKSAAPVLGFQHSKGE